MSFPLLKLPPEIVEQIFDEIGSSFFHQDLSRLTISKLWFEFAFPVSLRHIKLAQQDLPGLVASGSHAAEGWHSLSHNLEVLDLAMGGPHVWKKALEDQFNQFAQIVRHSHKLHTIRMQSRRVQIGESDGRSFLCFQSCDSLLKPMMRPLLSAETLRCAVLDLHGIAIGYGAHLCPEISTALGTLQTLHIRMSKICPDCIKPRNPQDHLRLRTVAVNLSLTTNLPDETSAKHSERCEPQDEYDVGPHPWNAGKPEMKEQLEALAKQMTDPKIVRLLSHPPPLQEIQTHSYDVLTGKTMVLGHGMAWDQDGEVLDDDDDGLPGSQDELSDYFDTYLDESDS